MEVLKLSNLYMGSDWYCIVIVAGLVYWYMKKKTNNFSSGTAYQPD